MRFCCRRVLFPWLVDVTTLGDDGTVISGIVNGVFTLTVKGNDSLCFVAVSMDDVASFVWPVEVTFGVAHTPVPVDMSRSNATHACVTLPTISVLCNGSVTCLSDGKYVGTTTLAVPWSADV